MSTFWFKLNKTVDDLKASLVARTSANVSTFTSTTDLPAVAGVFADLAAARAAVEAQRFATETRLDLIELKLNAVINNLKAAGLML